MRKVIPLFHTGNVQDILCEAADKGLSEIFIIGKLQSGEYWMKMSDHSNVVEQIGVIEMAKYDLYHSMESE